MVVRSTDSTMIFCSRSYMWPEATVKMWIASGSASAVRLEPAARPPPPRALPLLLPDGTSQEDTLPSSEVPALT